MNLRFPALAVLACLLAACASTSVKETWKAPDFAAPVGQIAVVALDGRGWLREGFENRLGGRPSCQGCVMWQSQVMDRSMTQDVVSTATTVTEILQKGRRDHSP